MKKILTYTLSAILLLSSLGITVSKHYCGDYLVSTSIFAEISDACDSSMPMEPEDCNDDFQQYNLDSPFIILSIDSTLESPLELFSEMSYLEIITQFEIDESSIPVKDTSPYPRENKIYCLNQAFII